MLSLYLKKDIKLFKSDLISFTSLVFVAFLFLLLGFMVLNASHLNKNGLIEEDNILRIEGLFDSGEGFSPMTNPLTLDDMAKNKIVTNHAFTLDWGPHNLEYDGQSQLVKAYFVTQGFSQIFKTETDEPVTFSSDSAFEAIISSKLSKSLFSENNNAVGQSIIVEGTPYIIIDIFDHNILIPGMQGEARPDIFLPFKQAHDFNYESPTFFTSNLVGYIKLSNEPNEATVSALKQSARDSFNLRQPDWGHPYRFDIQIETISEFKERSSGIGILIIGFVMFFVFIAVSLNTTILLSGVLRNFTPILNIRCMLGESEKQGAMKVSLVILLIVITVFALSVAMLIAILPKIQSYLSFVTVNSEQVFLTVNHVITALFASFALFSFAFIFLLKNVGKQHVLALARNGKNSQKTPLSRNSQIIVVALLLGTIAPVNLASNISFLRVLDSFDKVVNYDYKDLHSVTLSFADKTVQRDGFALQQSISEAISNLGSFNSYVLSSEPILSSYSEEVEVRSIEGETLFQARLIFVSGQWLDYMRWTGAVAQINQGVLVSKEAPSNISLPSLGESFSVSGITQKPLYVGSKDDDSNLILAPLLPKYVGRSEKLTVTFRSQKMPDIDWSKYGLVSNEEVDYENRISQFSSGVWFKALLSGIALFFTLVASYLGLSGYLKTVASQINSKVLTLREVGASQLQLCTAYTKEITDGFLVASITLTSLLNLAHMTNPTWIVFKFIPVQGLILTWLMLLLISALALGPYIKNIIFDGLSPKA